MSGEIRDTETAKIVIEASLTGRLVLSPCNQQCIREHSFIAFLPLRTCPT